MLERFESERGEHDEDFACILLRGLPLHVPVGLQAIDQSSGTVVTHLQALREFADGHGVPAREAFDREQRLVLLRRQSLRGGGILTEPHELAQCIAECCQCFVVSFLEGFGRCSTRAATISAIAIPPTGTHTDSYHAPMEAWLKDFELDTGKRKIKPYNPNIGKEIADMLRPSMGDAIPTAADDIAKSFGRGWWKPDPAAATELLQAAGFTKRGNEWQTPDGKPFTVRIVVEGDLRPVMTRAGSMIAQQWRQFGIDAKTDVAQGTLVDRRNGGDFDTIISWSVETWGGHPDLSFFLDSWHSQFVSPPGKVQTPRNWQRWASPALDKIIEQVRTVGFDDPKSLELGRDFVKLAVQEMPVIPLMAYNVFTVMDETYWKGYPSAETDPYTDPVPNWGNSRAMMVKLKPAK